MSEQKREIKIETVESILEQLPAKLNGDCWLVIEKWEDGYIAEYIDDDEFVFTPYGVKLASKGETLLICLADLKFRYDSYLLSPKGGRE